MPSIVFECSVFNLCLGGSTFDSWFIKHLNWQFLVVFLAVLVLLSKKIAMTFFQNHFIHHSQPKIQSCLTCTVEEVLNKPKSKSSRWHCINSVSHHTFCSYKENWRFHWLDGFNIGANSVSFQSIVSDWSTFLVIIFECVFGLIPK